MIITSTINLNLGTGKTATNAYLLMIPYVNEIESTGKVPCDLKFWYSEADKDAGFAQITPVVSGNIITNENLQFIPDEIVKADVNCTMEDVFLYFKTKLKTILGTKYGWTITI